VIVTHDARIFDMATRILDMEDGKLKRIERGEAR
jgi:putative ABC transport system ATP-binding protein